MTVGIPSEHPRFPAEAVLGRALSERVNRDQEDYAAILGVSRTTLSRILRRAKNGSPKSLRPELILLAIENNITSEEDFRGTEEYEAFCKKSRPVQNLLRAIIRKRFNDQRFQDLRWHEWCKVLEKKIRPKRSSSNWKRILEKNGTLPSDSKTISSLAKFFCCCESDFQPSMRDESRVEIPPVVSTHREGGDLEWLLLDRLVRAKLSSRSAPSKGTAIQKRLVERINRGLRDRGPGKNDPGVTVWNSLPSEEREALVGSLRPILRDLVRIDIGRESSSWSSEGLVETVAQFLPEFDDSLRRLASEMRTADPVVGVALISQYAGYIDVQPGSLASLLLGVSICIEEGETMERILEYSPIKRNPREKKRFAISRKRQRRDK